ncbi:hypothetical protein [Absidia glauca]|uniref:DUF3074 domain-containing protein n=1 Tax=Absidia glauca TaxID=4829 RepID=A0A163MWX3_ABSGL|nr:hypothetical protein [Absidia glauca]
MMIDSIEESKLEAMSQDDLGLYLDTLVDQALTILKTSSTWPVVEEHPTLTTRQSHTWPPSKPFLQCQSRHVDITYDQICNVIADPSSASKYVDGLLETKSLKTLLTTDTTQAGLYWSRVQSTLTLPRDYVDLVVTRESARSLLVVSQPVDTVRYAKQGHVRGQRLSCDLVCEQGDGVEWTRIKWSSAGGWVPDFWTGWGSGKRLYNDVDDLVDFIRAGV